MNTSIYIHRTSILPIYELFAESSTVFSTEDDYDMWTEGMYPPVILQLTAENKQNLQTEAAQDIDIEILLLSFEFLKNLG